MRVRWYFTVSVVVVVGSGMAGCGSNDDGLNTGGAGGSTVTLGGATGSGGQAMGTGGVTGSGGVPGSDAAMVGTGGLMMGAGGMTMGSGGMAGAGGMMMGMGGSMMGMGGGPGTGGMMMGMGGSTGASCRAAGTLQVSSSGATAYVIDGANNPMLDLCRGSTYVFSVKAAGHPFYINTVQGTGTANAYSNGVTGNGVTMGDLTFAVPRDAPDTLFYNCSIHSAMTGMIHILN